MALYHYKSVDILINTILYIIWMEFELMVCDFACLFCRLGLLSEAVKENVRGVGYPFDSEAPATPIFDIETQWSKPDSRIIDSRTTRIHSSLLNLNYRVFSIPQAPVLNNCGHPPSLLCKQDAWRSRLSKQKTVPQFLFSFRSR